MQVKWVSYKPVFITVQAKYIRVYCVVADADHVLFSNEGSDAGTPNSASRLPNGNGGPIGKVHSM